MKILLIHNKYLNYGGEDVTFENELKLLKEEHYVESIVFDNKDLGADRNQIQAFGAIFYNKQSYKIVEDVLVDFKPDIIHVHNFFYSVSPSIFFLAQKFKIPICATVQNFRLICSGFYLVRDNATCELCIHKTFPIHGIYHKCNRDSYLQSFALTAMTGMHKLLGTWKDKIDKIIVVTEFFKRKLINSSLHLSDPNIVVKPNSVDDHGFVGQEERKDFFLFVGRLSSEKGIKILIDAARLGHFKVKILGDGPMKEVVFAASEELPNVEYLGFQDKSIIIKNMKACKALLFPSIWYEGLPLTILEAFSTGTPVICSDIDNLNEIVLDNFNGLSFANGNATSLSEKITFFRNSPEKVSGLYTNARQTFLSKYSDQINKENLIAIYSELINRDKISIVN